MTSSPKILSVLVLAIMATYFADSADAKRGCASFGHSCFGGHGKRSEVAPAGSEPLNSALPLDPADFQALEVYRQFCSLQPEQYLRLAPIFRKLVATVTAEEEPLPRK